MRVAASSRGSRPTWTFGYSHEREGRDPERPGSATFGHRRLPRAAREARRRGGAAQIPGYSPLYECSPLNQSDPEEVTITIPNATTSSSAAGRPAHERWFRAWR